MAEGNREKWEPAIRKELESLVVSGTFGPAEGVPAGRKAVSSKWVFKTKKNRDGTIDKYKARLVARGFTQVEGADYDETFAPTVRSTIIRLVCALTTIHGWHLKTCDVTTAEHSRGGVYCSKQRGSRGCLVAECASGARFCAKFADDYL
jgi:Reverse transcriptase (RNA-dependent DNA polymerase)